jgi:hypothetical protein
MENPFDMLYEIDAHHAAVLAQAFCSANNKEELFAVLRFASSRDDKATEFYGGYLDGRCFQPHFNDSFDISDEVFEKLKDLAWAYRADCLKCPQTWKLAV